VSTEVPGAQTVQAMPSPYIKAAAMLRFDMPARAAGPISHSAFDHGVRSTENEIKRQPLLGESFGKGQGRALVADIDPPRGREWCWADFLLGGRLEKEKGQRRTDWPSSPTTRTLEMSKAILRIRGAGVHPSIESSG
jgi:hypothetical protein